MMRVKNHHTPPTMRPDRDLRGSHRASVTRREREEERSLPTAAETERVSLAGAGTPKLMFNLLLGSALDKDPAALDKHPAH